MFVNSKLGCARLARAFERDGLKTTALHGDKGASPIVRDARARGQVLDLAVDDEGVVTDIDTVDDLARAQELLRTRQS